MWGSKARRIADLEAREAHKTARIRELEEAKSSWSVHHLAKQLVEEKDAHRATCAQLSEPARYRLAWLSARERAETRGEGINRLCADRDSYAGWLRNEQAVTALLRSRLSKSEQGRRNLMGLLEHHRDASPLRVHRELRTRLARALRACAWYRSENARLTRQSAHLQARLDAATGLDAPGLDLGAKWQERRTDKPRPAVKP